MSRSRLAKAWLAATRPILGCWWRCGCMPARAASARPANWRADALAEKRAGQGKQGEKVRQRQPRVSTTDAQARVMKMPNGGFNPAVNVQLGSTRVNVSAARTYRSEERRVGKECR